MAHAVSHNRGNIFAKEARMMKVHDLLTKGYTHQQISDELGINLRKVYIYKTILSKRLANQQLANAEHYRALKKAEIDRVKKEAWEAWECSKVDSKGNKRTPNALFLDRILAAIESERKMYGIDIAKDAPPVQVNTVSWDTLLLAARQPQQLPQHDTNSSASTQGNVQDITNSEVSDIQASHQHPDASQGEALSKGKGDTPPVSSPVTSSLFPSGCSPTSVKLDKLRDDLEERLNELERRAEEKRKREMIIDDFDPFGSGLVSQVRPNKVSNGNGKSVKPNKGRVLVIKGNKV